ncbi:MAG TPA: DNA alkylation repair protein [Flavobacteriales bacterium]|jgi:3-methyladenine DNA glycosylase AlkD|nr:DNA alkylation repair protein [Flavobacteriales bacterium]
MTGRDVLGGIKEEFIRIQNPEKAGHMKAYMKNRYPFFGIQAGERKAVQKKFQREIRALSKGERFQLVRDLWGRDEREYQQLAVDIHSDRYRELTIEDLPHLEELITQKSWWDTVDLIASRLVAQILKDNQKEQQKYCNRWLNSQNMWLQRTAILFQLKYKRNTDFSLLQKIIIELMGSNEFFIQKAIGWSLREYSKTNPEAVRAFIEHNTLKPLSVREGSKYLK